MKTLIAVVATTLFVFWAGNASAQQDITIYVFSAPAPANTGFIDADTKRADKESAQRNDSVEDVIEALKKTKNIRLVDNAEEATLKLEVEWRSGTRYNPFARDAEADAMQMVRARLTVGTYTRDMIGIANFRHPRFKGAAGNLVREIEKWVKDNKDRLSSTSGE